MATRSVRLVERLQQQLVMSSVSGRLPSVSAPDIAELRARVRRLRGLTGYAIPVELSSYVAPQTSACVSCCVGGVCVATDR